MNDETNFSFRFINSFHNFMSDLTCHSFNIMSINIINTFPFAV